ncbi:MAG: DUF1080 domain-containing protein [Chitinophagaceae bacterium]|nr:DUF1080 domain-containing protein [Chitinophagaceae bacterium]
MCEDTHRGTFIPGQKQGEGTSRLEVSKSWGDSLITHIINGDAVLQYSKPQIGGGEVNRYSPEIKKDGQLLSSSFIALQSEGQPIDFKNIRIKDLSGQYKK